MKMKMGAWGVRMGTQDVQVGRTVWLSPRTRSLHLLTRSFDLQPNSNR